MRQTKTFSCLLVAAVLIFTLILFSPLHAQQYGWKVIARPTSRNLYAVEFVDSLHGWCISSDSIYRTTDGGNTWRAGPVPTAIFSDISFFDNQVGWASGTFIGGGGVLKTTNGGASWRDQYIRMQRRTRSTVAQSLTHNTTTGTKYFAADTGITIQTTNGGTTWTERTLADSIAAINKITFIDSLHGWALGTLRNASGVLLRTTNGGKAWQVLKTPRPFTAISFIDSSRGWARGGGVHFTRDGGLTWQFLGFNLSPEFYAGALSFVDSLNGWAFGAQFYQGRDTEAIYRTNDGGKSWSQESIGLTGDFGYITDAVMLDQHHGWAVSYDGAVLSYQLMTSVAERVDEAPKKFALLQNFPNPFNPTTTIQYSILKRSSVTIRVYDILGKLVATVVNEIQEPGVYRVNFDGSSFTNGTYLCKLQAGRLTATQKMQLLK